MSELSKALILSLCRMASLRPRSYLPPCWVGSIALWVVTLPAPVISAHFFKIMLGMPP